MIPRYCNTQASSLRHCIFMFKFKIVNGVTSWSMNNHLLVGRKHFKHYIWWCIYVQISACDVFFHYKRTIYGLWPFSSISFGLALGKYPWIISRERTWKIPYCIPIFLRFSECASATGSNHDVSEWRGGVCHRCSSKRLHGG